MATYSLTEKLTFNENPTIEIKGEVFEVRADARTVLTLMDSVKNKDEFEGTLAIYDTLFSAKDRKKIDNMNLSMKDFGKLIEVAMALAIGQDPDEAKNEGE